MNAHEFMMFSNWPSPIPSGFKGRAPFKKKRIFQGMGVEGRANICDVVAGIILLYYNIL